MIVCPGCGGRNEPGTAACTFCLRRVEGPGRGTAAGVSRLTPLRKLLLAALCVMLIVVGVLVFVLQPPLLVRPG
jgi:hypothetical protein